MRVLAKINGQEEYLVGIEAEIYNVQGEQAIINRRKYNTVQHDYLSSLMYQNAVSLYTPRSTKDSITYPVTHDNYDDDEVRMKRK